MDLLSTVMFRCKKEERVYEFIMPVNAPAGEVYDVLFEALTKVIKLSNENLEKMERKPETEK